MMYVLDLNTGIVYKTTAVGDDIQKVAHSLVLVSYEFKTKAYFCANPYRFNFCIVNNFLISASAVYSTDTNKLEELFGLYVLMGGDTLKFISSERLRLLVDCVTLLDQI